MKPLAITTTILLILALLGAGWLFLNANITVEQVTVQATEAVVQQDYFDQIKTQLANSCFEGTVFNQSPLGESESYQFLTYNVRLKNAAFVTADMVEVQITPMEGDVVQIGSFAPKSLPRQSMGDIQATILTDANMHSVRELSVTYYIWGFPFITKTTSGR
ncbi:MAG: hypothetical protein Q4C54_01745 [Clostridia bacterium]|nr:hypothetical protein [Clostridia bacterium]